MIFFFNTAGSYHISLLVLKTDVIYIYIYFFFFSALIPQHLAESLTWEEMLISCMFE